MLALRGTSPRWHCARLILALACLAPCAAATGARWSDTPFLAECKLAMSRMMAAMRSPFHGDDDVDFARLMIAHHEGAIAMARAELQHGRNEQLRRLAQEMIITQQQEIVAMRLAIAAPLSRDSSSLAPTGARR